MKIKAAVFNSITNLVNFIFTIITGLIFVPIYLKYFDLSTYGAWLASGNMVLLLTIIESGLSLVLTQNLSKLYKKDETAFLKLFNGGILLYFIFSSFIFLVGILILPYIPEIVKVSSYEKNALIHGVLFSLLATAVTIFAMPFQTISQVYQRTSMPGLFNTFGLIFSTLTLLFTLNLGYSVTSIGLGYFVRSIIIFISNFIYAYYLLNDIDSPKIVFDFQSIKYLLKEIILPFFSVLSQKIASNSQNITIAYFISPTLTAVYDITSKVTMMLRSLLNIISYSTYAGFALKFSEADENKTIMAITKFLLIYSLAMCLSYTFSFVFTPIIIKYWVGLSKYGGYTLLILIILSAIVSDFVSLSNMFIWSIGKYQKGALYDVLNVVLYAILLEIFIFGFGYYGVPLASFSTGIITLILLQKNILNKINLGVTLLVEPFILPIILGVINSIFLFVVMPSYKNITFYQTITFLIIFAMMMILSIAKFSSRHINVFYDSIKDILKKA